MELLLRILAVRRPHNDPVEKEFVNDFIVKPLEALGHTVIKCGPMENIIVNVPMNEKGDMNKVLFSCHTDTVHSKGGDNKIIADANFGVVYCAEQKGGDCLGADDGTGVWMLLKMIEAKIPGTYVFHRGEERGCIGSHWMSEDKATQEFLKKFDYAIAFDRKDRDDIITHQRGRRCCSDEFAKALGEQLNAADPDFKYRPDPTGVYTDTANYDGLIKECTNLSVGYEGAHGSGEQQDLNHAKKLLEAVKKVKWAELPAKREAKRETYNHGYSGSNWRTSRHEHQGNYGAYGRRTGEYGSTGKPSESPTLQGMLAALAGAYGTPEGKNRIFDAGMQLIQNPPMTMREVIDEALKKNGVEGFNDYLMAMVRFAPEHALVVMRTGLVFFQYYALTLAHSSVRDSGILGFNPTRTNYLFENYEAGAFGILFDKPIPPYRPDKEKGKQQGNLQLVETDPKKAEIQRARKERKERKKKMKAEKKARKNKMKGRQFTHGLSAGTLAELKNGPHNLEDPPKTNVIPYPSLDGPDDNKSWPTAPSAKNITQ